MTEENNFCVSCGAMLPPGAEFCPSCGAGVDGRTNPHSARASPGYATAQPSGLNVSLFILIYGVLALIVGLYGTYSGLTFDEAAYNEMRELYESIGMTIGPWDPSFATELLISGVLCLVSGVLALLSYWLCRKGGPKTYAVVLCIAAAVTSYGFLSFISIIVGLIVAFLLYRDNTTFTS